MKQIYVYFFMIMTVVFMVILINKNETKPSVKLLSVDTYYSFIDQENEKIYIDVYISDQEHVMTNPLSYESIEIHNESYSKSMHLNLIDIIYQHEESYLNESYYKYTYIVEPPLLGYDFDILESYLNVSLINGDTYDIYIGSLSLKHVEETEAISLDWNGLSGIKKSDSYVSRLYQIDIEYETLSKEIDTISLGNLYDVDYEIIDDSIMIHIDEMMQLFNACPVIITFEDQSIQVINYFIFIKDFEVLKQSGQMIYHYALN